MQLGAKSSSSSSSNRPTRLAGSSVVNIGASTGTTVTTKSSTTTGLKKPVAFGSSFAAAATTINTSPSTVSVATAATSTAPSSNSTASESNLKAHEAPLDGAIEASQSNLLVERKRSISGQSSLAGSDTGLSVCSSSVRSAAEQLQSSSFSIETGVGAGAGKSSRAASSSISRAGSSLRASSFKSGPTSSSASTSRGTFSRSATANKLQGSSSSSSRGITASRLQHSPGSLSSNVARSNTTVSAKTSTAASSSTQQQQRKTIPTLAMSLREKDQQIKLLIKERDEQKFSAELMARRAEEWEEKFLQSELERSHVTSEADDEVVELRRLAQELEDENRRLGERLSEREQLISDTQFKLDELECERAELKRELDDKQELLVTFEREQRELASGKPLNQVQSERQQSRVKYEREIEELKEAIRGRDEQMMQLRSSLEMRKNELSNLQARASDLERKLKIESERNERHLKRLDEINLELKASEAKLATKSEENEMHERQVFQLRQELRTAEEKLEQVSLARKKDVDILHHKLSLARQARAASSTPTSPQPYKTPTPQDEIVRLQMEIRDLKDQLIDREAELDCNRRDMELMRCKMETRTLEVDCNNQELARRCQDLLEQNRQSEETVKSLLKSTTEHSAQLMRATDDLKEANGKCIKLREEINELEVRLEEQVRRSGELAKENGQLRDENEDHKEQIEMLRQQVDSLNAQLSDLCSQLDVQSSNLHKDREALANQLNQNEIHAAQVRHELATAKQDLRTSRLQTQEVASERDRLKSDLEIKGKYISSRNNIIETLRHELEDCKKSLDEYRQKLEQLKAAQEATDADEAAKQSTLEADRAASLRELRSQIDSLKRDCQTKDEENRLLRNNCEQLACQQQLQPPSDEQENNLKRFEEMRTKHTAELDELRALIRELEERLARANPHSSSSSSSSSSDADSALTRQPQDDSPDRTPTSGSQVNLTAATDSVRIRKEDEQSKKLKRKEDYETQIEFLNSVVVDMQRKCDEYKNRLAQIEAVNIMNEFDYLILSNQVPTSRSSTMTRNYNSSGSHHQYNGNSIKTNSTAIDLTLSNHLNGPGVKVTSTQQKSVSTNPTNNNNKLLIDKPARISGRPYCDICRTYDLHHTIYCPKVSEKLASQNVEFADDNSAPNNNNNDNNNYIKGADGRQSVVDDLFREYEESLLDASNCKISTLRKNSTLKKPPRPYCDHCDLFGHTVKSCNSLRVV